MSLVTGLPSSSSLLEWHFPRLCLPLSSLSLFYLLLTYFICSNLHLLILYPNLFLPPCWLLVCHKFHCLLLTCSFVILCVPWLKLSSPKPRLSNLHPALISQVSSILIFKIAIWKSSLSCILLNSNSARLYPDPKSSFLTFLFLIMRVLPSFFETLLLERSYDHVIPTANSVFNLPKPQFSHLSVLWVFGLWWWKYTLIWNGPNLAPNLWKAFSVGLSLV